MKGIFGATNIAGFVSGANNCTTGKNPTYSAYASDNKLIIYRFKRGFLWGMYKKKGPGLLWAEKKALSGIRVSVTFVLCFVLGMYGVFERNRC